MDIPLSDHDGNNGDSGDVSKCYTIPENAQSNDDSLESSQSSAEESVTRDSLDLPENSNSNNSGKLDTSC